MKGISMRPMYRTLLAVLAVSALSALTASAALAAPEWYVKTGGKSSKLTSVLAVKATTNLTVDDTVAGGGTAVKCKGTIEGSIEPGGLGKVSSYVVSGCENIKNCPSPVTVTSINLPWKSELYAGGETGAKMRLVSGGSGTPGWRFECNQGPADLCNFNTSARLGNVPLGNVEAEFNASESARTTCSRGGAESGVLTGTIVFAHPEGDEAIEARGGLAEWRQVGAALTAPVATVSKGTVKLRVVDHELSFTTECSVTGEGSVEPGAAGTQTKWAMSSCKAIAGECESEKAGSLEALNLPWNTALTVAGGVTRDLITNSHGTAGFEMTCYTIFGKIGIACTGTFNTIMENVTGGVDARLETEALACDGPTEFTKGIVEGTQTVEATKGGKLEVT
jgi:hypothetical protein